MTTKDKSKSCRHCQQLQRELNTANQDLRSHAISELAEIGAHRDISAGLSRELFKTIALLAALMRADYEEGAGRLATDDADTNAVDVIERIKDVLDSDNAAGLVFTHADPSGLEH